MDLAAVNTAANRLDMAARMIQASGARSIAEIGVWKGDLAEHLLTTCPGIASYYLVDPWRPLDDWNKPFNVGRQDFDAVFAGVQDRLSAFEPRTHWLRGTTLEVIGRIPDGSLDFCYIDGDHTLRGIVIDLVQVYRKIAPGGWILGDDFLPHPWQHAARYEPTLVFPAAVYLAEALGAEITALEHKQFAMQRPVGQAGFRFTDLTGRYGHPGLQGRMLPPLTSRIRHLLSWIKASLLRRDA